MSFCIDERYITEEGHLCLFALKRTSHCPILVVILDDGGHLCLFV